LNLLITSCVLGKVMGWNFSSIFCATLWRLANLFASSPATISRKASPSTSGQGLWRIPFHLPD
jgi:hypothetical protein